MPSYWEIVGSAPAISSRTLRHQASSSSAPTWSIGTRRARRSSTSSPRPSKPSRRSSSVRRGRVSRSARSAARASTRRSSSSRSVRARSAPAPVPSSSTASSSSTFCERAAMRWICSRSSGRDGREGLPSASAAWRRHSSTTSRASPRSRCRSGDRAAGRCSAAASFFSRRRAPKPISTPRSSRQRLSAVAATRSGSGAANTADWKVPSSACTRSSRARRSPSWTRVAGSRRPSSPPARAPARRSCGRISSRSWSTSSSARDAWVSELIGAPYQAVCSGPVESTPTSAASRSASA